MLFLISLSLSDYLCTLLVIYFVLIFSWEKFSQLMFHNNYNYILAEASVLGVGDSTRGFGKLED